jgi:hypothetical protein
MSGNFSCFKEVDIINESQARIRRKPFFNGKEREPFSLATMRAFTYLVIQQIVDHLISGLMNK